MQTREAGEDRIAPAGFDYKQDSPTAPNSVYPAYHMELVRRISGGLLTAYHTLGNDPSNVNMNAGRLASLEDREGWKIKQHQIAVQMVAPIFSRPRGWLTMYLTSGISPLPFSKRARFDAATWQGRRWTAYDLNGEVAFNEYAVKHGITTDTALAAEYGKIRSENIATVKQEMKDEAGTPIANRFETNAAMAMRGAGEQKADEAKPPKKDGEQ
jgi:capsid protein